MNIKSSLELMVEVSWFRFVGFGMILFFMWALYREFFVFGASVFLMFLLFVALCLSVFLVWSDFKEEKASGDEVVVDGSDRS